MPRALPKPRWVPVAAPEPELDHSQDFRLLMSGEPSRMLRANILTEAETYAVMEMLSRLGKIQSAALARLERWEDRQP